ncbi:hypothetical protein HDU67_006780 [Dinochytrium kinnereticum]|nr:hypothetical protein HDU67_006780 [Dinochytrium kinnereticum]
MFNALQLRMSQGGSASSSPVSMAITLSGASLIPASPSHQHRHRHPSSSTSPPASPTKASPSPSTSASPIANAILVDKELLDVSTPDAATNASSSSYLTIDLPSATGVIRGRLAVHASKRLQDIISIDVAFLGTVVLNADALKSGSTGSDPSLPSPPQPSTPPSSRILVSVKETLWSASSHPPSSPHSSRIPTPTSSTPRTGIQVGTLTSGRHEFPFALHVPRFNALPPSIETGYGRISYKLVAIVHRRALGAANGGGEGASRSFFSTSSAGGAGSGSTGPGTSQQMQQQKWMVSKVVRLSRRRLVQDPARGLTRRSCARHLVNEGKEGLDDDADMSFEDFLAAGPPPTSSTDPVSSIPEQQPQRGLILFQPSTPSKSATSSITPSGVIGIRMINGTSKYVLFEYKLTLPKDICIDSGSFRVTLQLQAAPGSGIGYIGGVTAVLEERRAYSLRRRREVRKSLDGVAPQQGSRDSVDDMVTVTERPKEVPVNRPRRKSLNIGMLVSMAPKQAGKLGTGHHVRGGSLDASGASNGRTSTRGAATPSSSLKISTKPSGTFTSSSASPSPTTPTQASTDSATEEYIHQESLSDPIHYPIHFPSSTPTPSTSSTPSLTSVLTTTDEDDAGPLPPPVPSDHLFVMTFNVPVPRWTAWPDVSGCGEVRVSHALRFCVGYSRWGEGRGGSRVEEIEVPVGVVEGCLSV